MVSIGIDVGTSTICACLLDVESGKVLRTWTQNHGYLTTSNPREKIQSVDKIENIISSILMEITSNNIDIACLGLTGQMHGILYLIPREFPSRH
jgi:sedoheptulokinase